MINSNKLYTTGIVVSHSQYSNESAIIMIATDDGILSFIAPNIYKAKSQLKPLLLTFAIVEVEYKLLGEDKKVISYVKTIFDPSTLYSDYTYSLFLMLADEITNSQFKFGDKYPIDEVKKILNALNSNKDPLSLMLLFVGTVMRSMGLKIKTDGCINCDNKSKIVTYSLQDGGFICSNCIEEFNLLPKSSNTLYCLKYSFMDINEKTINTKVPQFDGTVVLVDLLNYLANYFDYKAFKSLPLFIDALK
jgi:DNA repair protein RecO (recombination protein O)